MPKAPLTFYTYVPRHAHASYFYRVFTPFHTMRDLGLPVRVHVDTNDAGIDPEARVRAFCEADVILLYQPIGDPTLHNIQTAKSFMPSKRDGDWKWPPTLIIDTDDNLFNVNPYNSAYRGLGIRDHEGKDIPLGHMIGAIQDGRKKVLWEDGKDGFDIARNRQNIETYRKMINMADVVTATTPRCIEAVVKDASPRRTQVFPNMVRFDQYEQVDLVQDQDRINILWQGGSSHYEDWYPLRQQLGNITKKYPQVHWKIWGTIYPWVTELIPPDRYSFISWCDYAEYKLRLVMMNHQINLAPLNDNRFNRCRSAIKFYEGSVMKHPAATLAQDTGPYHDELIDGETALLFKTPEEFETQLSTLIENSQLRTSLASNAKDWVSENRDAFKLVPKQLAYYESLRDQIRVEQPHMPESEWATFEEQMKKQDEAQEAVAAGGA